MSKPVSRLHQQLWRLYRVLARALLVKQLLDAFAADMPTERDKETGPRWPW